MLEPQRKTNTSQNQPWNKKNPLNEVELPLNQRQLAKQKLEKEGAKEKLKTNRKERKPKEQTTTQRHDKPNAKGNLKTCYTYIDKSLD